MESKKTKRANVDRQTGLFGNFFLIGLVVATGLVTIGFQWHSKEPTPKKRKPPIEVPEASQIAEVTKQKEKKPKPPAPPKIEIDPVEQPVKPDEREVPEAELVEDKAISMPDGGEAVIKEEPKVFKAVEQEPEYPGGRSKLFRYLRQQTQYPSSAKEAGIEGTVIVNFVVNKDGSITDVQIGSGVSSKLNKEALRVVKNMPKWKPGKQRGKRVRVRYRVPIRFSLN